MKPVDKTQYEILNNEMVKEFLFDERETAHGRNGTSWAIGISVYNAQERVTINPINTTGFPTSGCQINIPKKHLQELIDKLKECL